MSVLYQISTPNQGAGAWIGFRKVGNQIYWIQGGDEWAQLVAGGSPVQQTTDAAFAQIVQGAQFTGPIPPAGWLSPSAQQVVSGNIRGEAASGATAVNPGAGSGPSAAAPAAPAAAAGPQPVSVAPQVDSPAAPLVPLKSAAEFFAEMEAAFPWIAQLGLPVEWFQELAATSASGDMVLAKLRQSDQYRKRFVGMRRPDGSLRMDERQYLATEAEYRKLLRQYGFDEDQYSSPVSLIGFFEGEIDVNELRDRLDVHKGLQEGSQAVRDAFYVYAGLDVSVDDLFEAIVDPAAAQRLTAEYNERIASGKFDYKTFIARATNLGLQRVAQQLGEMESRGAVTGQVVQAILKTSPDFAASIMDALYTGGSMDLNPGGTLDLQDLLSTFEYAALGAAATGTGLELPTLERVAQFRQAGLERNAAARAYQQYSREQGSFTASLQRIRGQSFGQSDFEDAAFLGSGAAARDLEQAQQGERAAGRGSGTFRFDQERGNLFQRGLKL